MRFTDGGPATAEAVIGRDSIRSCVRQLMLGEDNPQSTPQYSHVYAYRGLLSMDEAIEAVGTETAMRRIVHVSKLALMLIQYYCLSTSDVSRWARMPVS